MLAQITGSAVERVMVIAAHPDDEVIGAGAELAGWPGLDIVYATNGSPRDPRFAKCAGFNDRHAYARARMGEAIRALALAKIDVQPIWLGFDDQEAVRQLAPLTIAIRRRIGERRPDVVVTHAFEGGHPDHDAVALAVNLACTLLARQGGHEPCIVEMTSYFARSGLRVVSEFRDGEMATVVPLTPAQSNLKALMYAAHASQQALLRDFPCRQECFRRAPRYDFRKRPQGEILYASEAFGITPQEWETIVPPVIDSVLGGVSGRDGGSQASS